MRRLTALALAAMALSLSSPLAASANDVADDTAAGNIIFGRPLEPGINVVWLSTDSRNDQRAPVIYRDPSPETRANAQSEVMSDPMLRDFIARRHIAPHNVLAIETAANGGKILFAR
ncbi:hypothetical protein [Pararhizobium antarcticum]|uniref:Uncharacterized protein n=1 Tax=Pararhizobium antarcticum TaxID=1798805 RepID=A0A657LTN7_9HYPH|nr:hypothetical protein [Pararhizobium antarcticum]OJF96775.1 hypothetical protein AX760_02565 [Pararhizobium antarcticum]OJF98949.1 hypothetical protein AX761_12010 [Rhizobium sp. 58]